MRQESVQHSDEMQAWAALYALGSLGGEEQGRFEQHLRQGCASCEEELRSLGAVVDALALSAPLASPSVKLRQRLLDAVGTAVTGPSAAARGDTPRVSSGVLLQQPGLLISRSQDITWEEVAPGIARKLLYLDVERAYATSLIRLAADTRYPSHRHADVEEILVLEGDLQLHGVTMRAGDYCRAEPDSIHLETYTESGCLLLQLTSQHDQIQA